MRSRSILALVALSALITLVSLRQHVRVVRDVVHTYSTFWGLLQRHPELLYRYPENVDEASEALPKIIHHVALGSGNLTKYEAAMKSCRDLHPDWQHQLWTDSNATSFMAEHYPDIAPHYENYFQNIQRANVLRYALLHKFGGVYFDLDVTCLVSLETTPLLRLPFVTPGAHPAGVNNAFIVARRGHAFLTYLLGAVPVHDLYWGAPMRLPYVENMFSAGCMFFSNIWMKYAEDFIAGHQKEAVKILADENGDIRPHMLRGVVKTPIMAHGGASSWHGWDAAAILVIGKYYMFVVSVLAAIVTLTTVILLFKCLGSRLRRRRAWWKQGGLGIFRWAMGGGRYSNKEARSSSPDSLF